MRTMAISKSKRNILYTLAALSLLLGVFSTLGSAAGVRVAHADDSRTFPETGKTVSGKFLDYWNNNGGLAQQGYPISDEVQEQSDTDGKTYTMQYFERAVFEMHPENQPPYDVLLSLLGTFYYNDKYKGNAPGQEASTTNPRKFTETGKTIGGVFRAYWESHGGLTQQGYPISDEFQEVSATDGKTYTVQYFQRAVFEYHPEKEPPFNVLLSLLGVFFYNSKHGAGGGGGGGGGGGTTVPPESLAKPGWTSVAVTTNNIAFFYSKGDGSWATAKLGADGSLTPLDRGPDPVTGVAALHAAWDHVVAAPNNLLVFYHEISGLSDVYTVSDAGILNQVAERPIGNNWSYIAIDIQTGIITLYNQTNETLAFGLISVGGNISIIKTLTTPNPSPNDFRWSQFVPIGRELWLWYVQGNGNGVFTTINGDGSITNLKVYTNFDRDWTNVTFAGTTQSGTTAKLYLYKQATGVVDILFVDYHTGDLVQKKVYNGVSTGWTNWASAPNGVVLAYDATGAIATDNVDDNGSANALKRYRYKP